MSDPFAPTSKDHLIREAQRGLAIVAILLAVLAYVAFDRMTDRNRRLPEHVRNAPIAQTVWPYANEAPDSASRHAARRRAREQNEPSPDFAQRTDYEEPQSDDEEPHFARSRSIHGVEPAEFQDDLQRPFESAYDKTQQPVQPGNKPSALAASSVRDFVPMSGDRLPPILTDKPYPHAGTASSDLLTNASNKSFDDSPSRLEAGMVRSGQDVQRTIRSDAQLDPFESSVPQEKTAAVNQNPEDSQLTTNQSDFSTSYSQVQSAGSPSTQDSTAINALAVRAPTLIAPNPIEVPADTAASSQSELAETPSAFPGRMSVSNGLGSNEADSKLEKSHGQLAPATRPQTGETNTIKVMLHRVVESESYYSIAQDYYGDGNYFRALSLFNQELFNQQQFKQINRQMAEDLLVGAEIKIPAIEHLEREYPNEVPKRTGTSAMKETNYVTKQGETLFDIAANELGQASRYLEIMELNREQLPLAVDDSTPLPANLKLFIPK